MASRIDHSNTVFYSGAPRVTAWGEETVASASTTPIGNASFRKYVLDGDVLSFKTSKSIDNPTGRFTLQLLPRDPAFQSEASVMSTKLPKYFSALRNNTPISIGYDQEGGIMLGLVESCDFTSLAINNQLQYGLTVEGTDLGYALDDHILTLAVVSSYQAEWDAKIRSVFGSDAPILRDFAGAVGPINSAGNASLWSVSIEAAVDWLLTYVHGFRIPLFKQAVGGSGYIGDFIEKRVSSWSGDKVWKEHGFLSEETVKGLLLELLDRDFYEMRVDTLPPAFKGGLPRPVLIVRPKPFDEEEFFNSARWPTVSPRENVSEWSRATTLIGAREYHTIESRMVVGQLRLGRSRRDVTGYYTAQNNNELGMGGDAEGIGASFPIYDFYASTGYVTQRYDSRVSIISDDPSTQGKDEADAAYTTRQQRIAQTLTNRRNRLFCWNRANGEFISGSVKVAGSDAYRVGDIAYLPWLPDPLTGQPGIKAYITAVTHEWQFGGMYTCTLSLSRGHGSGFWEAFNALVNRAAPGVPGAYVKADRSG